GVAAALGAPAGRVRAGPRRRAAGEGAHGGRARARPRRLGGRPSPTGAGARGLRRPRSDPGAPVPDPAPAVPRQDVPVSGLLRRRVVLPGADLRRSYDVVVVGGGGHGLALAYYLARDHGIRNVAVLERGELGLGATGRNTTIVRANYRTAEAT